MTRPYSMDLRERAVARQANLGHGVVTLRPHSPVLRRGAADDCGLRQVCPLSTPSLATAAPTTRAQLCGTRLQGQTRVPWR